MQFRGKVGHAAPPLEAGVLTRFIVWVPPAPQEQSFHSTTQSTTGHAGPVQGAGDVGHAAPPLEAGVLTANVLVPSPQDAEQADQSPWQSTGHGGPVQFRGDVGHAAPPLEAGVLTRFIVWVPAPQEQSFHSTSQGTTGMAVSMT